VKAKIYGESDDLVELRGDVTEEWGCFDSPGFVLFPHGVTLRIEYSPDHSGNWRITQLAGSSDGVSIAVASGNGDPSPSRSNEHGDGYSDVATVEGNFDYVMFSESDPTTGKAIKGSVVRVRS
jgi:hypothetical protein